MLFCKREQPGNPRTLHAAVTVFFYVHLACKPGTAQAAALQVLICCEVSSLISAYSVRDSNSR